MHFRNTDKDGRLHLIEYPQSYKLPVLNKAQVELLENASIIKPFMKAQLLQLTTGTRATTELWTTETEISQYNNVLLVSKESSLKDIEVLLSKLPFFYSRISLVRKLKTPKDTATFEKLTLIQVSISDYVDKYINNYWQTFSSYDQGVLYGYPTTTISAFSNLIERYPFTTKERLNYTPAMESIGPGIYSKKFFDAERSYYDDLWDTLRGISSKITNACEEDVRESHKDLFSY